jgi:GTPase
MGMFTLIFLPFRSPFTVNKNNRIVIAKGGQGGRGNSAFMSASNKSPKTKELGKFGEVHIFPLPQLSSLETKQERVLELELKTMADVGFVGYPNAGKSTLLSKLSNATPKIMPYPFTTRWPHVGVLEVSDSKRYPFSIIW